jgi:hypothetical protein
MILDSDDFVLEGTDLNLYHHYQCRITAETAASRRPEVSQIRMPLAAGGLDISENDSLVLSGKLPDLQYESTIWNQRF